MLLALAALPAAALTEAGGRFESGAYWSARVPDGWRPGDGLVIWNHGFDLNPLDTSPDLGDLAPLQLSQGYAVTATSYSQTGWALFSTLRDQRDLVAAFAARFGEPRRIYLTGGSLGGLVSVQGAEAAGLDNVAGVYSLCGALGGSRLWDAALDLRLAYDAVCGDVPDAGIPGGAEGLPDRLPPEQYGDENVTGALGLHLGDKVNACTGVLKRPEARSPEQRERLQRLMALLDIPDERFFLANMGYATFGLADLVHDPGKLDGAIGNGNRGVDYGDRALNRSIERVRPAARDRLRLLASYTPDGDRGETPMVAIHTSRDGLVPVGNLGEYRDKADPAWTATAVVEESEPSHCGFSAAEAVAGWNLLTGWVEGGGERPGDDAFQAECLSLAGSAHEGPCRYAAGLDAGDLSHAVRPRRTPGHAVDEAMSGAWFDPERAGEGWVIEVLDDDRALVYWFTYPPMDVAGQQSWLMGVGKIAGGAIRVELMEPAGRAFGNAGRDVALRGWGEVEFTFSGPNAGMMRWAGPPGYSAGQHPIRRLAGPPHEPPSPDLALSGSWYDRAWDGEGWHLMRLDGDRVLVYWFTFDGAGLPAWVMGVGRLSGDGSVTVEKSVRPRGAAFGHDFDAMDVAQPPWGSLRFDLDGRGCRSGRMSYDSERPAFGRGERRMVRLTVLEEWCGG